MAALGAQTRPARAVRGDRRARRLLRPHRARSRSAAAREHRCGCRCSTGPGRGAGAARRAGMDLAAERLLAAGTRRRPRDLHRRRLATRARTGSPVSSRTSAPGARAVAGLIELDPEESSRLPDGVIAPARARRRGPPGARPRDRSRRRPPPLRRRVDRRHRRRLPGGRRHRAGAGARGRRLRRAAGAGRHPDPPRRRRPRADLRPRRRPGRAGARRSTSRSRRGPRDGGTGASEFAPELLRRLKGATSVAVVIPTKECADTLGGVLAAHRGPAARRRGGRRGAGRRRRLGRWDRRDRPLGRRHGDRSGRRAARVRAGARQGRRDVARAPRDRARTSSAFSTGTRRTRTRTTCRG